MRGEPGEVAANGVSDAKREKVKCEIGSIARIAIRFPFPVDGS